MPSNTYIGTNVGAMGEGASATGVVFDQRTTAAAAPQIDLNALAAELERLRPEARKQAQTLEHDEAVTALGRAEEAARKGDVPGALSWLKKAGNWAAKVASEFSASVVAKLIEGQLGG